MSDAYGTIVLAKSKDCKFDIDDMLKTLSVYHWGNDDQKWKIETSHNKTDRYLVYGRAQYPTLFPEIIESFTVEDTEGNIREIDAADMAKEDYGNEVDCKFKHLELDTLSKEFSEHIREGWIELAAVANEKAGYVYYHSLRVYANGNAVRKLVEARIRDGIDEQTEIYDARTGLITKSSSNE